MTQVTVSQRLKGERERFGFTLGHVAEKTGLGESSLSEFENGRREPRIAQLNALARLYRRPISFFFEDGQPAPELVLWREKPAPQVAIDVESQFLALCRQYHNLEVWCGEHRGCNLPTAHGDAATFEYADAAKLAHEVRAQLSLGDRPGESLVPVLEELCGVKLFYLAFEPSGTAASTVNAIIGSAVLLNAKNVQWRRNFDLAHELFHLLTWNIFRGGQGNDIEASQREEKLATCFASNLLMPEEPIKIALSDAERKGPISYSDLFDVARQFDVSVEALLWRIHFLRKRNESETKRDIERCKDMVMLFDNREQVEPPTRPARYVALAVKAVRHGEMSTGRFAEYMGISRRDAMKRFEQEAHEDEEVAIPAA